MRDPYDVGWDDCYRNVSFKKNPFMPGGDKAKAWIEGWLDCTEMETGQRDETANDEASL